jgi:pimeloyl-ACP methyl ester carboxylesterase
MDIVLVAGLWLDGSAWDDVASALGSLGHRAVPLTLPGQGDGDGSATLEDQVEAVVAAVDAASGKPLVVGHSAACALAWLAADARPDRVAAVTLVGGFPAADGERYAASFETDDGVVPFPGWSAFEGPDSADLDEDARGSIEAAMIPVPAAVTQGVVRLRDERRHDVPVLLVCPEFTPAEVRGWIDSGDLPELSRVTALDLVDIDSGHWPMFSAPAELARILAAAADRHGAEPAGGRPG